jgi:hypothetical protein
MVIAENALLLFGGVLTAWGFKTLPGLMLRGFGAV